MKVQIACLSVLTAIAGLPQQASAADFGNIPAGGVVNGGIRDYGGAGGVPVPAPVPIPDYKPSYYFRLDAGIGSISQPSVSESGFTYGGESMGYPGPAFQTLDPDWISSDFSTLSTFGAGVGYYLGGGLRIDATIEKRSNDQISISGSESWETYSFYDDDSDPTTPDIYSTDPSNNGDANFDGSIADRRTTITVNDRVDVDGTVWMANAYYDLGAFRGFTPYIGGGVGFIWNQIDRTHTTTLETCPLEVQCGSPTSVTTTTSDSADTVSLAAAAMVGFSYQMSDITSLDVGYRYLYLGGTSFTTDIDGAASRITIGDQQAHQIRAGLRFDVN